VFLEFGKCIHFCCILCVFIVVDSPRKSMTSRLSEMRSLMITPTDSTANLSLAPSTNLTVASSSACTASTTMMQAPRESRSAEALCTACGEHPQVNFNGAGAGQQSMWKSSDSSSSRCDLDNCLDNISLVHCPDESIPQKAHVSPAHRNNPLSQQNQPLQIAKPLPSAMERCLSCMSKLGQQGTQDILSPSWTMDLNSLSNSTGAGNGGSSNGHSGNSMGVALPQGSIGSGNSDRLSISSHGSSGGGGGGGGCGPNGGEFYGNYDTPRSVLVAEMRRGNSNNGRCNTPPGVFQGGNGASNCHFSSTSGQQQPGHTGQPSCGSPYRRPPVSSCGLSNGQATAAAPGGSNNIIGCGVGNCHCQRGPVGVVVGVNNSHIYYNSVAEQQHTNNKSHKAPNLHPGHLPGPYENYDFPRCVQPPPQGAHSLNSYPSYSGESVVSGCVGSNGPSSIDWTKVRIYYICSLPYTLDAL